MPAVGEKAPDFELKNQNGERVRLSDFRGQKVVLFAFPQAATPGCTTQACGLRNSFPHIQSANAIVLGLSPDPPEDLLAWKQAEKLPYDLLCDPEHREIEAWGAWGEKTSYGRTYVGVIRSHWIIGEDGTILDAQVKVSPKDSVERVNTFLAG